MHYSQFHRRKKAMTPAQGKAFEAELIAAEMLAPPKPTGRAPKDDPFAAIAERITKKQLPDIPGVQLSNTDAEREQRQRENEQALKAASAKKTARSRAAGGSAGKSGAERKRKGG
ncbi:MAG: hypothetical protein ACF788_01225 [Novipirellula sp. JB048]